CRAARPLAKLPTHYGVHPTSIYYRLRKQGARTSSSDRDAALPYKPQQRSLADTVTPGQPGGRYSARILRDDPLDQILSQPPVDPLRYTGSCLLAYTAVR
ncbi:MAG: hypothetical protein WAN44_17225, partial [Propionibacteriaceae bacterium]